MLFHIAEEGNKGILDQRPRPRVLLWYWSGYDILVKIDSSNGKEIFIATTSDSLCDTWELQE